MIRIASWCAFIGLASLSAEVSIDSSRNKNFQPDNTDYSVQFSKRDNTLPTPSTTGNSGDHNTKIRARHQNNVNTAETGASESSLELSSASLTPDPIQYLVAENVPEGIVDQWLDSSPSSRNAFADSGTVTFPSNLLFPNGEPGLDFGRSANSLRLFQPGASDTWLDQSASSDGFSLFIALKCEQIIPGVFNDILGNSTDGSTGLQIGFDETGEIQARLGGESISAPTYQTLESGDTVVLALRYDAANETYAFWESKNLESVAGSLAKADFSTGDSVTLGMIDNPDQYLDGIVGEVRIYDTALDDDLFKEVREDLLHRWAAPPNIVMIFIDDWAWNGSSVLMDDRMNNSGLINIVDMPNLEMMAAQGMIFRNAYASPQCGPSRSSLQTGQTNARSKFTVVTPRDEIGYFNYGGSSVFSDNLFSGFPVISSTSTNTFPDDATTIPQALEPLGYMCAHLGKWHIRSTPDEAGYILHDGNTSNSEGNTIPRGLDLNYVDDPKLMNHVTQTALDFMTEQYAADNPFYVQLSHYAVHSDVECFPETRETFQDFLESEYGYYTRENIDRDDLDYRDDPASWLAMFHELDQTIGQVYDKLQDLGIEDNTYVVVMSDNGFRHEFVHDITEFKQPLNQSKWWVWQGGIRVPMFATGPGIPAGTTSTANVANYDLLPTFLDWAGGDPSRLQNVDGKSLKSLMAGEQQSQAFLERSLYFHFPHYRITLPHSCIIKGNHKVMYFYEAPVLFPDENPIMLFDLNADPGEFVNIYPEDPRLGDDLYNDLMAYLESVEARIPIPNTEAAYDAFDPNEIREYVDRLPPDWDYYDPEIYEDASAYYVLSYNESTGFFVGTRRLESTEAYKTFTEYWAESWGSDIDSLHEDFDGDTLNNFGEYVFGLDPTVPNAPSDWIQIPDPTDPYRFSFNIRTDDSNIAYEFQTSTDLEFWAGTDYTIERITTFGTPMEQQTVLLDNGEKSLFIRLRVSTDD